MFTSIRVERDHFTAYADVSFEKPPQIRVEVKEPHIKQDGGPLRDWFDPLETYPYQIYLVVCRNTSGTTLEKIPGFTLRLVEFGK